MATFMMNFLYANIFIVGIIVILLIAKRLFKAMLSSRMQYNLWYILMCLLLVPFIPIRLVSLSQIIIWFNALIHTSSERFTTSATSYGKISTLSPNWLEDFAVSVNKDTSPYLGYVLSVIWIVGMLFMVIKFTKSSFHLHRLKASATPLQTSAILNIYMHCLNELKIKKRITIYSSSFFKSPVLVGLLNPSIFLPSHIEQDDEKALKYILIHELQHYKHKDALANHIMNFVVTLYWFNPFVWLAAKEMYNDREIACDTSVLKMLNKESYEDYGNTLINLAEKLSLSHFATGISGNTKQIHKRIMNIASYKTPNTGKRIKGIIAFILITAMLISMVPFISTYATENNHYQWDYSKENISYMDLSTYFGNYNGSFVLYDMKSNNWNIYNLEYATLRVSPNSTYKIYDALFGLEEGIISPDDSLIPWNGEMYPFDAWNSEQTLNSAMNYSVNWYFQAIDNKLGVQKLNNYFHKIGYGNKIIGTDISSYWLESTLKISPIEQVQLLTKLCNGSLDFAPENINAVKKSICLSSSQEQKMYGKTGTGRVNDKDVNGWFVGFIETNDNSYFFATNICSECDASGTKAAEITMSILSDMNIHK